MAQPPDLATAYANARRLVASLEYRLQQLEEEGSAAATATSSPNGPDAARSALSADLNALAGEAEGVTRLLESTFVGGSGGGPTGTLWRKRVAALHTDVASLRRAVERFLYASYSTSSAAAERASLMGGGSTVRGVGTAGSL